MPISSLTVLMVTRRRASTPPALAVSVALNDFSFDFVSRCLALLVSVTVIVVEDPAASVRRTVPTVREPRRPSFFAVAASTVSFASSVHRAGQVTRSFAARFPDASSRSVAFGVGVGIDGRDRRRHHGRVGSRSRSASDGVGGRRRASASASASA